MTEISKLDIEVREVGLMAEIRLDTEIVGRLDLVTIIALLGQEIKIIVAGVGVAGVGEAEEAEEAEGMGETD